MSLYMTGNHHAYHAQWMSWTMHNMKLVCHALSSHEKACMSGIHACHAWYMHNASMQVRYKLVITRHASSCMSAHACCTSRCMHLMHIMHNKQALCMLCKMQNMKHAHHACDMSCNVMYIMHLCMICTTWTRSLIFMILHDVHIIA